MLTQLTIPSCPPPCRPYLSSTVSAPLPPPISAERCYSLHQKLHRPPRADKRAAVPGASSSTATPPPEALPPLPPSPPDPSPQRRLQVVSDPSIAPASGRLSITPSPGSTRSIALCAHLHLCSFQRPQPHQEDQLLSRVLPCRQFRLRTSIS